MPTNTHSFCDFLGLTRFYSNFIKGYASITTPLTSLLQKEKFHWSDAAQTAFDNLKHAITQAPILALLDFSVPFTLETDAFGLAMGAVLMQHGHPLACFSKIFCPRLQRASTYVRELHAITTAIRKWCQYLLGHSFIILTDHKSLYKLMNQVIQTSKKQVYLSKLLRYDYSIQYKFGKAIVVANALSRLPQYSSGQCLILSMPHPLFLDAIRAYIRTHTLVQDHIHKVTSSTNFVQYKFGMENVVADFKFHGRLLFFKNKIWLDPDHLFRTSQIEEFHSTPIGGHIGFAKTLHRL